MPTDGVVRTLAYPTHRYSTPIKLTRMRQIVPSFFHPRRLCNSYVHSLLIRSNRNDCREVPFGISNPCWIQEGDQSTDNRTKRGRTRKAAQLRILSRSGNRISCTLYFCTFSFMSLPLGSYWSYYNTEIVGLKLFKRSIINVSQFNVTIQAPLPYSLWFQLSGLTQISLNEVLFHKIAELFININYGHVIMKSDFYYLIIFHAVLKIDFVCY